MGRRARCGVSTGSRGERSREARAEDPGSAPLQLEDAPPSAAASALPANSPRTNEQPLPPYTQLFRACEKVSETQLSALLATQLMQTAVSGFGFAMEAPFLLVHDGT